MNKTEQEALLQARLIKNRSDYDALPVEVKEWVESILRTYGEDNELT